MQMKAIQLREKITSTKTNQYSEEYFMCDKKKINQIKYFVKECTIPAKHGPIGLMNQTALICKANKNVDKKDE